ncbi:unnamed protein product [Prorocentrum cordatum]|uniref:RING-type domain-containing protein n=1 Tax=Prorocentrum cordatum TaxID=2364126 RepID=A0ABN9WDB5_9DINO|nr:unnamed protein product [Polarella glacialis]
MSFRFLGSCYGFESALEAGMSVGLSIWCFSAVCSASACADADIWTPLAVLAVANIIRSGVAAMTLYVCTARVDVWRSVVSAYLLSLSYAVLFGHAWIVFCWHRASIDDRARERSHRPEATVRFLIPMINDLSSIVWCVCVFSLRVPTQSGPPYHHVASFVVRDVNLKCMDSTCAICFDNISSGCLAGRLPCGHVYHDLCLRTWLYKANPETPCPMRCSGVASSKIGLSAE